MLRNRMKQLIEEPINSLCNSLKASNLLFIKPDPYVCFRHVQSWKVLNRIKSSKNNPLFFKNKHLPLTLPTNLAPLSSFSSFFFFFCSSCNNQILSYSFQIKNPPFHKSGTTYHIFGALLFTDHCQRVGCAWLEVRNIQMQFFLRMKVKKNYTHSKTRPNKIYWDTEYLWVFEVDRDFF